MRIGLWGCHLIFLLVLGIFIQESDVSAKSVVDKKEIVFGQTGTFSGHLGLYGNLIKNVINAYFKRINESGGINGCKLRLESMEDGGNPVVAKKNIKHFLGNKKINMFLGCTGTRSILSVLPMIKNGSIAMFFPWAGDVQLRDPALHCIINGLGYLKPQLDGIVKNIVDKKRLKSVAIFHADDDFSTDAANYLENALQKQGVELLSRAHYNRMTVDVNYGAAKLLAADPKVIICIATSMPTVKLIGYFFEQGHYATEFVGIDSTLFVGDILKERGANFSFTSCVCSPKVADFEMARNYRQDVDKYCSDDGYNTLSFAYYCSAAIIVEAIKNITGVVSKEAIIGEIEKMRGLNIGGFEVNFDPQTRHAFGKDFFLITK